MTLTWLFVLSGLSLAAWIYLVWLNGAFWRISGDVDTAPEAPERWPGVTAIIPARDEGETIDAAVGSLAEQDYPGVFQITVVDDQSSDGTAECVRRMANKSSVPIDLVIGSDKADGWTGKLWALKQGVEETGNSDARYFWFSDADIVHGPENLRRLVSRAEQGGLGMASQMVMLRCETWYERLLIPAFVYFFRKLYPFDRVNRPASRTAAAAGGSILINREILQAAGGLDRIRSEIIDDCSLAALIKPHAPIRLDLTADARSIRPYNTLADVWSMVSRTAFVQLRYSVWLLFGSVLGMAIIYLAPPLLLIAAIALGAPALALVGLLTLCLMAMTYRPMLGFYGLSVWWAIGLPIAGALYLLMTIDSARRYLGISSPDWKGRRYDPQ